MEFKKGDKVKLKEGLIVDRMYGTCSFMDGMQFPKSREIVDMCVNDIEIEGFEMYNYTTEMLNLIPERMDTERENMIAFAEWLRSENRVPNSSRIDFIVVNGWSIEYEDERDGICWKDFKTTEQLLDIWINEQRKD